MDSAGPSFLGLGLKLLLLKHFLKRSDNVFLKLLLFFILSTALVGLKSLGPESLSLWIFPCGLWRRMGDAFVPAARSAPLSLICFFHPCAKTLDCSRIKKWRSVYERNQEDWWGAELSPSLQLVSVDL